MGVGGGGGGHPVPQTGMRCNRGRGGSSTCGVSITEASKRRYYKRSPRCSVKNEDLKTEKYKQSAKFARGEPPDCQRMLMLAARNAK